MNSRERFNATMYYEPRDRCPWGEMGFWPETLDRWHKEGWPDDVYLNQFFGFDRLREGVPVNMGFVPAFERQVIEETDRYIIVRRETGVTAKEFKGDLAYHMPQWLEFPLKTRGDWENEIKPRLDPESAVRYPEYWEEKVRMWQQRDYPLTLRMGSIFGWLRNWMGLETIALELYDDPAWIQEMMDYLVDFCCACGERALKDVDLDYILLWEDMAYKNGPLISPRMFRQFMLEPYKKLTGFIRDYGVDLIFVDSDGDALSLIPLFIEGGVNGFYPIERAAGMDAVLLRQRFGRDLRLMGGIDKRAMISGPDAIDRELARHLPLIAEGGFIPWCDHHVPPDVPLEHYLYYVQRMKQASLNPDQF
ncbi:MAG: uroporphyrinogen decarboxylase family protein [Anaerolineae bacterium]|nr:uroporphyrinogen decarboxylase family protein [Anaerolineae bacterium]